MMLGKKELSLPILQGGMGVGVSLGNLAGHVAACGGMGTISTANPGFREPDFSSDPLAANLRALTRHVQLAKQLSGGAGLVAVNAMVATRQYADCVRTAIAAGVDAVVSGAGLPLNLPELAQGSDVALAPVVSSPRAAGIICRAWDRRYDRLPDFVVLEGREAGGHLGFSRASLEDGTAPTLEELLPGVLAALEPYRQACGRDIPVFVAGGLYTGADIARFTRMGAAGGQLATRFIATYECDASQGYKDVLLSAKAEDVVFVKSPAGMPGRALNTPLIQRVARGRIEPERCMRCLIPCDPAQTPYCITRALIRAVEGDREEGLFFCGSQVGRLDGLCHVSQLMETLMTEWRALA